RVMMPCRGVHLLAPVLFLLLCRLSVSQAEWMWGEVDSEDATQTLLESQRNEVPKAKSLEIANENEAISKSGSREGRSEVYPEGPLEDNHPRFLGGLKQKLCSIGLGFKCKNKKGYAPATQHYGKPADIHEVTYVQPVEIRPVGKPIPALPTDHGGKGGGGGGYGNNHRDSSYADVPVSHGGGGGG
ncbi:unnamed protein product, partial [Meganyctiphanes norvegica]